MHINNKNNSGKTHKHSIVMYIYICINSANYIHYFFKRKLCYILWYWCSSWSCCSSRISSLCCRSCLPSFRSTRAGWFRANRWWQWPCKVPYHCIRCLCSLEYWHWLFIVMTECSACQMSVALICFEQLSKNKIYLVVSSIFPNSCC